MTAVLDPPTEEAVDLATDRWEVQTTLPMAVTAPPAIDFVIMSHAEQAPGDFPIGPDNPDQLLDQLLDYAQREMGLTGVSSGVLFREGAPVAGYIDNRPLQNETAAQALRSLMGSFVVQVSGIARLAQRNIIEEHLARFPVPIFGSPPNAWETIGQLAGSASFAGFAGYAASIEQPVMAYISGGTALLVWFFKPLAKVTRRTFTERAARWMGGETRPDDFT